MAIGRTTSWRTMFPLVIVFLIYISNLSYQSDTILPGQSIRSNQTIISRGGVFTLRFFSPYNIGKFYVGITYNNPDKNQVWVGNRDKPILSSDRDAANLILTREGDLQLQVNGRIIWNTNTTTTDVNTTKAILLDNGNLIVGSDSSHTIWESFDYPSATWLPGAKIGLDPTTGRTGPIILTGWNGAEDPSPGIYSFGLDQSGSSELLIWNRTDTIWRIGALDFFSEMNLEFKLNITFNVNTTKGVNYITYHPHNESTLMRINMASDGQLRLYILDEKSGQSITAWTRPNVCDNGATCGNNGICSADRNPVCSCPEGFRPNYTAHSELRDYSVGCARINESQCLKEEDEFIALHNIKRRPQKFQLLPVGSTEICRSVCTENCSCTAYSNATGCYLWYGDLRDMEQMNNTTAGETIFLRSNLKQLPKKDEDVGNGTRKPLWIFILLSTAVPILVVISVSYYVYRKKITRGARDVGQDLLLLDLERTDERDISQVQGNNDLNIGNRVLALPIFSLSSILSATDNFSPLNKLGEGGFGPVYKGKLRNGQEVAIKRLSKQSGQGVHELINEAKLIAKLQHTNLVRFLGCCIQKDEKILIYEYMPNKSLDYFLFDRTKKMLLDWSKRMSIIEGIAQGLLYLHHYSRLRIIHRDLKASNILLDANMKPKISDFGMAKIFGGSQLQANTKRIVGTYGYMPPEYALEGIFSIKTDIFSFGVLLLEILSGERNAGFHHEEYLNLLEYAWNLWTNGTPLELIDPIMKTSCNLPIAMRYIHIALLCVQEHPNNRPSIFDIVAMIGNEMRDIEIQPKQPAYLVRRRAQEVQLERSSLNELTYSAMHPR